MPDPKAAAAGPTAASQDAAFNNLMGKAPAPAAKAPPTCAWIRGRHGGIPFFY